MTTQNHLLTINTVIGDLLLIGLRLHVVIVFLLLSLINFLKLLQLSLGKFFSFSIVSWHSFVIKLAILVSFTLKKFTWRNFLLSFKGSSFCCCFSFFSFLLESLLFLKSFLFLSFFHQLCSVDKFDDSSFTFLIFQSNTKVRKDIIPEFVTFSKNISSLDFPRRFSHIISKISQTVQVRHHQGFKVSGSRTTSWETDGFFL